MKGMRNISPLGVRITDELKSKIQEQAKSNGRSMNAEIVNILEASMNAPEHDGSHTLQNVIDAYENKIQAMESYIKVQTQAYELAKEQIALLKQHIKTTTGFDVQEFFNKVVDYEAIEAKYKNNKKPT